MACDASTEQVLHPRHRTERLHQADEVETGNLGAVVEGPETSPEDVVTVAKTIDRAPEGTEAVAPVARAGDMA